MFQVAEKKIKNHSSSIFWIILCAVFIALVFFSVFFIFPKKFDYYDLLKDKEKDIVYSSFSDDVLSSDEVPVVNLNSSLAVDINKEIMDYYENYLTKFTEGFFYEYSVSDQILSILIISQQRYVDALYSDVSYHSFTIDLEKMTLLSDEDIFEKFHVDTDKLRYFITYQFVSFYNDLIAKDYFRKEECDFSCFMDSKNIVNVLDGNTYYVKEGQLHLYKPFNIYTTYGEENYFSLDSFHFVVKE